ncbi:AntiBacterial Factor related [Caenorhabditis elegans]|uniref:AntiBacterial Factor related n=1 Tax=Caenorhabditis elegans TaxID=6239 RepID=O45563_CAEEL|nr:AntiBacterial Factor related [Caenorhabditis elegans]CAB07627.1 AntiBacterial Factor related [Caenorhabditis elegans]|eukprot:NP_506950.1 AntiBacterial Factor related [Caenorhabditis elegans]
MNFSFLFFIFAFLIGLNKGSVCLTRRTDWGQLGAIFTNPVCDVWCRIRQCGPGQCKEDPMTSDEAQCVCEKCYRDSYGNAIYPGNNGLQ